MANRTASWQAMFSKCCKGNTNWNPFRIQTPSFLFLLFHPGISLFWMLVNPTTAGKRHQIALKESKLMLPTITSSKLNKLSIVPLHLISASSVGNLEWTTQDLETSINNRISHRTWCNFDQQLFTSFVFVFISFPTFQFWGLSQNFLLSHDALMQIQSVSQIPIVVNTVIK